MNNDEKLSRAMRSVEAAVEEARLAIQFHETWRPTVSDAALLGRMGNSYAMHSFHIIRIALRRELLLALTRIWDKDSKSIKLTWIEEFLKGNDLFDALVEHRAKKQNVQSSQHNAFRNALEEKRRSIRSLIQKYVSGDESYILERLKTLRNEQLAHRQIADPTSPEDTNHTNEEVEAFYQDTLEIIRQMYSLFYGTSFDLSADVGGMYRHYAMFFWESARGEGTEGHPRYKKTGT